MDGKYLTLIFLCFMLASVARAQKYNMHVEDVDGVETTIRVENVDSVTVVNDTWSEYATGVYTYNLYFDETSSDLVLYRHNGIPNRWKIANWAGGVDFCFTFDENTGKIVVDDQDTGYFNVSYGEYVWVDDITDYDKTKEYAVSYFDDSNDTFYFALVYYISEGYFNATGITGDHETFAIKEHLSAEQGETTESEQQNNIMTVTRTDGSTTQVMNPKQVSFTERPDMNVGWTSLGYCLYGEDMLASILYISKDGDLCCDYYVEVQENDSIHGLYRLVNPYGPDVYPFSYLCSYDTDNDYYMEIDATDSLGVFIDYQDTGMYWRDMGEFYVYSEGKYYYDHGRTWEECKEKGYCGTLVDGVISFPRYALFPQFPEEMTGYGWGNMHRRFKLDLNDKSDKGGPA